MGCKARAMPIAVMGVFLGGLYVQPVCLTGIPGVFGLWGEGENRALCGTN